MSQQPFALDTIRFISQKTTDSNPFGDRDQVTSLQAAPHQLQQHQFPTSFQNEQLREEARQILETSQQLVQTPLPPVFSDSQKLISVKQQILQGDPDKLINVLLFWIEFQVSRGMPNHNQCVLNVLQDMKNLFIARNSPQQPIIQQLTDILCSLVQNINNDDFDATESIVDFVQVVGVYFMKSYLIERQVVNVDPESFDLLSTWIYFQYIMKRQIPVDANANDVGKQLLDCMKVFEERVSVSAL